MSLKKPKKVTISHGRIREVREVDNVGSIIKRLIRLIKIDKKYFLSLVILVLCTSGIGLLTPYLLGKVINSLGFNMGPSEIKNFKLLVFILLITYIGEGFFKIIEEFVLIEISQASVFEIRDETFNKLQKLPMMYFDMESDGEIMSRMSNDVEEISSSISETLAKFLSSIILLLGSIIMMFILSWKLTLASFITLPITYFFTRWISQKSRYSFRARQENLGRVNSHLEESISGIEVVKSFNNQDKMIGEFKEKNRKLKEAGIEAQILSGLMMPMMNVIKYINFTTVAVFGGYLAINGQISLGAITSFISYSKQFSRPLNEIANTYNILQSGLAGGERIFEILDEEEERKDRQDSLPVVGIKGDIEFIDVNFSYVEGEAVLKNINFKVKAGSNIALVGPTGAGKTTIVNLISGLYENYSGEILIDGRNILDYRKDDLRKSFGSVLQDTYLFSGSVEDNIRYGKLDASLEEIRDIARLSRASDFIDRMPKGYKTDLTEFAGNISQGERQLLTIARAIISDPKILILDEATSSVDTKTELKIQEAMVNIMKGRTTFMIAHRLSTIRDADLIFVIDGGQIVEQGSHKNLLKKDGYYSKMFKKQILNT